MKIYPEIGAIISFTSIYMWLIEVLSPIIAFITLVIGLLIAIISLYIKIRQAREWLGKNKYAGYQPSDKLDTSNPPKFQ